MSFCPTLGLLISLLTTGVLVLCNDIRRANQSLAGRHLQVVAMEVYK